MIIRDATIEDAYAIEEIYKPIVLNTAISFEEIPPSAAEFEDRILTIKKYYPFLVAVEDNSVIGYAYASQHRARAAYRWSADITVYISTRARRAHVATRLYKALIPILKIQKFRSIYAGITQPNEASVKLHEKFGFKYLATYPNVGYKLGKWHDVGYWHLDFDENVSAVEPIPYGVFQRKDNGSLYD